VKKKALQLAKNVRALREARGWGAPEVARRMKALGVENASATNIQNVEKGGTPRAIVELASVFGKSVEDLYDWRPGMPTEGPNHPAPQASKPAGPLTQDQLINRLEHDVDQLRTTLWNMMDVVISRIPTVAAELKARLEVSTEAQPDKNYGDKGFHARVLSTLQTIAQTQEAVGTPVPPSSNRGPSRQKRGL
jgi:hypothetical protein